MAESLNIDDLKLILEEVRRFVNADLGARTRYAENPMAAGQLAEMTGLALDNGLFGDGGESPGIWSDAEVGGILTLSAGIIEETARVNGGTALHWHQLALGRWLRRRLGAPGEDLPATLAITQGCYGLGRSALPAWLQGRPADRYDSAFLRAWLDPASGFLVCGGEGWQHLLVPAPTDDGQLRVVLAARNAMRVEEAGPGHGFDELNLWQVFAEPSGPEGPSFQAESRVFGELLMLNALGLMAIALGTVRRAYELALEYSGVRRQGGRLIREHAAVRQMLADMKGALATCDAHLGALTRGRLGDLQPPAVFAAAWVSTTVAQEVKHYRFAYDQPKTTGYGIAGDLFAS